MNNLSNLVDKLEADNLALSRLLENVARKHHALASLNSPKRHKGSFEVCQDSDCLNVRKTLAPDYPAIVSR